MKNYLKILALFAYGLATIITCSAVWNSKPGAFISIVVAAVFATNGYVIFRKAKAIDMTQKDGTDEK